MPDKLVVTGETRAEAISENECRRVHRAHVDAKIFGLGGMLESRLMADMGKSYEKGAKFSNTWMKEHL